MDRFGGTGGRGDGEHSGNRRVAALDSEVALEVLGDGVRRAEWPQAEAVLRQAGPVVWPKLAELVVRGPGDSAQRAGALLGFSAVTKEVRAGVALLRHGDPSRRHLHVRVSAKLLGRLGSDAAAPFARVLATMFDDPDPRVVAAAVGAFADIGPEAVPILQEVRRSAHRSRRAALAALAEIGWDTIAPTDTRALARLIASKLHAEIPQPFYPDGEWHALRTDDRDAVLRAFDLSYPVPITMRAGFARWRLPHPPDSSPLEDDFLFHSHRQCTQMFISPILDGWTLVFGTPKRSISQANEAGILEPRHDDPFPEGEHVAQRRRCVDLSRQFGTVYWYVDVTAAGCGDWMGWCLAERGSLIRYYHHDFYEGEIEIGKPLAAETGLHTPDGSGLYTRIREHLPPQQAKSLSREDPSLHGDDFTEEAMDEWCVKVQAAFADQGVELLPTRSAAIIAARTTVGPCELGPHTSVQGHGVLALTNCGRRWGHRGAFPL
jgi:hypothetical protein